MFLINRKTKELEEIDVNLETDNFYLSMVFKKYNKSLWSEVDKPE